MAVVVCSVANEFSALVAVGGLTVLGQNTSVYPFPWPGSRQVRYVNKAWDTVAGNWVVWETLGKDTSGVEYPGPGTFGVTTSDYRLQGTILVDLDQ